MAILCSLHQVDLALEFADRVVAVSNGQVSLNKPANQVSISELKAIYSEAPEVSMLKTAAPTILKF